MSRLTLCLRRQGPKLGHLSHFWHMVFHESKDVAVIVMLTQTSEAGREMRTILSSGHGASFDDPLGRGVGSARNR